MSPHSIPNPVVSPISQPARILVGDGEPASLRATVRLLEQQGYTVEGCADGSETLGRALAWAPDVVLLDQGLPRLPGHRVCASLKAAGLPISVILLTRADTNPESLPVRADGYLRRPVRPAELLGRVRSCLEGRLQKRTSTLSPVTPIPTVPKPGALFFHVLGPFRVRSAKGDVDMRLWKRRKPRSLLKYLLTRYGHLARFDELQGAFWPGVPSQKARASLHVCARNLRRSLEPLGAGRVVTCPDGYMLRLGPDDWLDLEELDEALARVSNEMGQQMSRALQALPWLLDFFGCDLLVDEPDAPWVKEARSRLREGVASLLARAAAEHRKRGELEAACGLLERRLALEPGDEQRGLDLAECLVATGATVEALAVLNKVEEVVRREGNLPGLRWAALRARMP